MRCREMHRVCEPEYARSGRPVVQHGAELLRVQQAKELAAFPAIAAPAIARRRGWRRSERGEAARAGATRRGWRAQPQAEACSAARQQQHGRGGMAHDCMNRNSEEKGVEECDSFQDGRVMKLIAVLR